MINSLHHVFWMQHGNDCRSIPPESYHAAVALTLFVRKEGDPPPSEPHASNPDCPCLGVAIEGLPQKDMQSQFIISAHVSTRKATSSPLLVGDRLSPSFFSWLPRVVTGSTRSHEAQILQGCRA